jgi:hypothetical protein
MSKHAKQHYVPQSYLSAWVDSDTPQGQEPYVWVFPKEETAGRKKAPKNVFWEGDMYTIPIPGGGRDLRPTGRQSDAQQQLLSRAPCPAQRLSGRRALWA